MKFLPRHRKLFYVPGMISLILLPLASYWYFFHSKAFDVHYSMDFSLPAKNPTEESRKRLPSGAKLLTTAELASMRQYKTFVLNGSAASDAQTFKAIRTEFKRLITTVDTVHGVKIRFGRQMHYDAFITTIDYLAIEQMPVYGLFGDDMYVIVPPVPKNSSLHIPQSMGCGGVIWGNDLVEEAIPLSEKIKEAFMREWKIYSALTVLILINIFSLLRFNKNKMLYLNNH